jgi:single-strand DNA-binding protein|tara:strand:+ start:1286 stop:1666 length:381 start_codon:yes stop_codon:yes gene_type:complete
MAGSHNSVTLVGNLGADPELRTVGEGTSVVNLSLATNKTWKNKDGSKGTKTTWHSITFWNRAAEVVSEYCRKGTKILITGSLDSDKWTDDEGVERTKVYVVGDKFEFLDSKQETADRDDADDEIKF